jgi:GNAT superfamily N-acetyltransferase
VSELAVVEETTADLEDYARIPIAFEVRAVLDVTAAAGGLGGLLLTERALDTPHLKDYDAIPGESPLSWPERFDLSRWGVFAARLGGGRVGGAAVALDAELAAGRSDVAVLWDIRVAPDARGHGVGAALFRAAAAWAAARGARRLMAETQNVNVAACRFYARQGCVLGAIHRFAYPSLPHEVQLLWFRDLTPGG